MAETFDGVSVSLTTTGATDLYQCPPAVAGARTIVLGLQVANVGTGNPAAVTIAKTDGAGNVLSTLLSDGVIPAYAALESIQGKLILKQGEKLQATAGAAGVLDVTVSVLEITP